MGRGRCIGQCYAVNDVQEEREALLKTNSSNRLPKSGPPYFSSRCTDLPHHINQYGLSRGQVQLPMKPGAELPRGYKCALESGEPI